MVNSDKRASYGSVVAVFSSSLKAARALEHLRAVGVDEAEITVRTEGADGPPVPPQTVRNVVEGAQVGAVLGGAFGSVTGWISGLGTAAIPGAGPEVGSGALTTMLMGLLTGAAVGALLGSLLALGSGAEEAQATDNADAREGDVVVIVRPTLIQATRAESILRANGADTVYGPASDMDGAEAESLSPVAVKGDNVLDENSNGVDNNSVTGTQDAIDPETGALGTAGTPMTAGYGVSGSTVGTGTAREGNPYERDDYMGATPDSPAYESGGRSSDDAGKMPGVERVEPNVEEKYAQPALTERDAPRTGDVYEQGASYGESKSEKVTTPKSDLYSGASVSQAPSHTKLDLPDEVRESAGTNVPGTDDPRGLGDNTDEQR